MPGFFENLGGPLIQMILQIGFGLVAVIILIVLFYSSRAYIRWRNKQKNFKIQALIHNPDGTFYVQMIGKFKDVDNIDKMKFIGSTETCPVIPLQHIRQNKVELWRYAPAQYAVISPNIWGKLKPEDFKIEVINLQMKNFAFLEQRAAVSRWAYMKDIAQKYAPYITILLVLIFAGVAIYFLTKMALAMYTDAIAQRVRECSSLLGTNIKPVGT